MPKRNNLNKQRELVFADEPAHQVERAYILLDGLPNCEVQRSPEPNTLLVSYSLEHYTLEGLERALAEQGFVLDDSLLHRIGRQGIYYCEDTEIHNLGVPDEPTKKREEEIFARAYQQQLHGDHDDTPPESRKYK